jgi:hypothetical protein
VDLEEGPAERFRQGQSVPLAAAAEGPSRVYSAGVLLGVGEGLAGGSLQPARLVARD